MTCEILSNPDAILLTFQQEECISQVRIDLKGATVTSWKVNGRELIFVSPMAQREGPKAIRGGIPIVFPQFGKVEEPNPASKLPQHGFARILRWTHDSSKFAETDEMTSATFILNNLDLETQEPDLHEAWSYTFNLTYEVSLGSSFLSTSMSVTTADHILKIPITPLLHSYLVVEDISEAWITGLNSKQYIDKVDPSSENKVEDNEKLVITSEVDRIYIGAMHNNSVCLHSGSSTGYHIQFESTTLEDVVVWNPWIAKAQSIADMDNKDYKKFVCVELGKVQEPFFSSDFTYGQKMTYVEE